MERFAGADWLEQEAKIEGISPLGRRVGEILGQVFAGIYHIQSVA